MQKELDTVSKNYIEQKRIAELNNVEIASFAETNWTEIVALYTILMRIHPSPIIALNRAVAQAQRDGAQAGLDALDELQKDLHDYYLYQAARADLLAKTGNHPAAKQAYEKAIQLTDVAPEKRFLTEQMEKLL